MIRLALFGTTHDAENYARLIARLGQVQLVALGVRGGRAAHAADADVEYMAGDFTSLLADHAAKFDAIVVTGDPRDCMDDCHRAAEAGKHLLLQQMFALSPSDAAVISASCANAGVRLMAGDSLRFHPQVQAIWKSVSAGQLGVPGLLRMHCWESTRVNTRGKLLATIDLAMWLFGKFPRYVYSTARPEVIRFRRQSVATDCDYLQLHLGFDGGGMALIDHSRTLPPGDGYFSLTFLGSNGAAYADDQDNAQLLYGGGRPTALHADLANSQALGALREFVAADEDNRQPLANGADVLRAFQAVNAVEESLVTRGAIEGANQPESLECAM